VDILIRNVPPETVHRLNVLAAVAGMSREAFLLRLLEREGARFSLTQVSESLKQQ
jgi:hypothetical protein